MSLNQLASNRKCQKQVSKVSTAELSYTNWYVTIQMHSTKWRWGKITEYVRWYVQLRVVNTYVQMLIWLYYCLNVQIKCQLVQEHNISSYLFIETVILLVEKLISVQA